MLCSRLTEVWIRQIYILCFQVDKFKGKSIDIVFLREFIQLRIYHFFVSCLVIEKSHTRGPIDY
jgi:hypothetical protein